MTVLERHLHGRKTKLIPHSTVSQRERAALFPEKKENQNQLGLRTVLCNKKILFRMNENYFLGIFWLVFSCKCTAVKFHLHFSLVYLMTLSVTQSRREYSASASRLVCPQNSILEGALFESRPWHSLRFRRSSAVHRILSRQAAEYYIWATAFSCYIHSISHFERLAAIGPVKWALRYKSQENHLEVASSVAALEATIYRNNSVVVCFC